ncbi:trypco2 family protein [Kitasatospora sp. NPDC048239]|uniref:trypco2 family protein n=1 Tax=Kitasatospora sp. NPDC048239 TaxID=3364046 RepID=UPI00371C3166
MQAARNALIWRVVAGVVLYLRLVTSLVVPVADRVDWSKSWRSVVDIELSDAVAAVRDELLEAAARGAAQNLQFKVGPVELEFAVELRVDAKVKAGFKAWVVTAGTEGGVARGRTHKVKVTLTPQNADGTDVMVHGDSDRAEGPGDVSGYIED